MKPDLLPEAIAVGLVGAVALAVWLVTGETPRMPFSLAPAATPAQFQPAHATETTPPRGP